MVKRKPIVHILQLTGILVPLLCLGILVLLRPDQSVSDRERRKLRQRPQITWESVLSGKFEAAVEPWLLDQVPFRDELLDLRSLSQKYLYHSLDDNGIVSENGYLIALQQQVDEGSLSYAANLINTIVQKNLSGTDCHLYAAVVPEKGYFLADGPYAQIDYDALIDTFESQLDPSITRIPLCQTLSLADYYYSDSHWNQVMLADTASVLASAMGASLDDGWEVKWAGTFEGVYAGQTAWNRNEDEMQYLESTQMQDWTVTSWNETGEHTVSLYDFEKLNGLDPYEFFLSGNAGLITIGNPHGPKGKQLILFRDSYGSAIAPLLASGYEKVTLVDLRNLPSFSLKNYVDFTDQDILFLFSTTVLNAAYTLK